MSLFNFSAFVLIIFTFLSAADVEVIFKTSLIAGFSVILRFDQIKQLKILLRCKNEQNQDIRGAGIKLGGISISVGRYIEPGCEY